MKKILRDDDLNQAMRASMFVRAHGITIGA